MDPILNEELEAGLSGLASRKSPELSRIPNEFWKKAPQVIRKMLHHLLNECIKQRDIPTEWKHATIVLIPKKETWGGNLKNTRPITLIETGRKILTRILTSRISKTCTEKEILQGENFSVLKNTSTAVPIQIINFVTEHAINNKRSLWLVTQDMKKAYDSVSTTQ